MTANTKETANKKTTESHTFYAELSTWWHAWRTSLESLLNKLPWRRPPQLWSTTSYLEPLLQNQPENRLPRIETVLPTLEIELLTFFHEYVQMKQEKVYPYSEFGLLQTSGIRTSELCRHHQQSLESQGKKTDRASLETWVAESLEAWMASSPPVGAQVLSISPPGNQDEGYPGTSKKNYAFINCYERTATGFQLTQWLSFDPLDRLDGILEYAVESLGAQPLSTSVPRPISPQQPAHQVIARLLELPAQESPTVTLSRLRTKILEKADTWPIAPEDLPQLDTGQVAEHFAQQLEVAIHTILDLYQALNQDPQQPLNQESLNDNTAEFDLLVEVVRQHLLAWVEDHAPNYQAYARGRQAGPYNLEWEQIIEAWQLKLAQQSNTLDAQQRRQLRQLDHVLALNPAGPLFRAASLTHCVVGTPGSILQQASSMLEVGHFAPGLALASVESAQLQIYLESLTKIEVHNRSTNQIEIWYLLVDPTYITDYQKGCYRLDSSGPIYGPCDIVLEEDNLVVAASLITEAEFEQLQQQALLQEVTELIGDPNDLSPEDNQHLQWLLVKLQQQLFRATLSSFVSGSVETSETAYRLPADYRQQLLNSPQPLVTLQHIVADLEDSHEAAESDTWHQLEHLAYAA